ncbi:hypothetical protein HXX01_04820 [Candidatus Nomurabacteria bacterium]|nr:hypothetical protein [Candidatus Nomurabacteria bacterium]
MGLFDIVLKKSNKVGGTARWVAEEYKTVRKNNPKLGHLEILERVNTARCAGYKDSEIIRALNAWLRNEDTFIPKGLFSYVYRIIQAESCSSELPPGCSKAINDELEKAGIEHAVISWRPGR